jgi:hypothetical protein
MVALHQLIDLLMLSVDLVVKSINFLLEIVLLSAELLNLSFDPFRLSSSGAHELLFKFFDLTLKVIIRLFVLSVVLGQSLILILFDLFDLGVDVILLLEDFRFVLKSLVQMLSERVHIMDCVNKVQQKVKFLFICKTPSVLLWAQRPNFLKEFGDLHVFILEDILIDFNPLIPMKDEKSDHLGPDHLFIFSQLHDRMDEHSIFILIWWRLLLRSLGRGNTP